MASIGQMEQRGFPGGDKFATALLLSIAYAASIGGIATLVGTPPNGVLLTQFRTLYPDAPPIGFLQWMCIGVPIAGVFLPVTWLLLTRVLFNFRRIEFADAGEQIAKRLLELGRMSRGERVVLAVWIVTALLWIFSDPIDLGAVRVPGWTSLFNDPKFLNHGTVAIASTVVLFVTPVNWRRGEFALDWEWARRIPWDILILFGGGIAMADAFRATGLTLWLGDKLTLLDGVPPILVVLAICALFTFLTEITSNTATAAILLPILGGPAAQALGVHPLLLMLPAALSVSCAFMLPVATPPNAIVFAGGHVSVPQMARAGLLLNLIGVALVTSVVYTIRLRIFDIQLDSVPAWTLQTPTP